LAHAAIAFARAHGWHLERLLADYAMNLKWKAIKRLKRFSASFEKPPHLEDVPGLTCVRRSKGWEARWCAKQDLAERGFRPKYVRLWIGPKDLMTENTQSFIEDRAIALQTGMLRWKRDNRLRVVSAKAA
jgi:hypothetical protein